MPNRVLVTGGTGFIGRALVRALTGNSQLTLLLMTRQTDTVDEELRTLIDASSVELIEGDIHEPPFGRIEKFEPDTLVHLAWNTEPGRYLTTPENHRHLRSSIEIGRWALDHGVATIIGVGTCLEYAPTRDAMDEELTPLQPTFLYGRAKLDLFNAWNRACDEAGARFSWARIFYAFGPGEPPSSMASRLAADLMTGQEVILRTPMSRKDFIFVEDVADALARIMYRGHGPYNVGLGETTEVRRFAELVAEKLGRPNPSIHSAEGLAPDAYPFVRAANDRLRQLGWMPRFSIEAGIEAHINHISTRRK